MSEEPQMMRVHDHTTGIIIGDARIPGHDKTWSGITANLTSWKTGGVEWAIHQEYKFILIQETRLSKKQARGAKSAAHSKGNSAVFAPPIGSDRKDQNHGGVGVMVQYPRKVKHIPPPGQSALQKR